MYELDFTTCTLKDVILRSAICHPSLFREAMLAAARTHREAQQTLSPRAAALSLEMEGNLRRMADEIDTGHFDVAGLNFSERVQAFHIAATLQCLSPDVRFDISARHRAIKDRAANDNPAESGMTIGKLALASCLDEDVLLRRIAAVLYRRSSSDPIDVDEVAE